MMKYVAKMLLIFFSKPGVSFTILIWVLMAIESESDYMKKVNQWLQFSFFLLFFMSFLGTNLYLRWQKNKKNRKSRKHDARVISLF